MVTLTALVLTITMVVVQLAMGQFSPRIVQTILQDKPSQLAIGHLRRHLRPRHARHARGAASRRDGHGARPGDRRGVRARRDQHRRAGPLRAPHRPVAAGRGADRARRHGHPRLLDGCTPRVADAERPSRDDDDPRPAVRRGRRTSATTTSSTPPGRRTAASSCGPASASSCPPGPPLVRDRGRPGAPRPRGCCRGPSCSASSARSTRTSPTGSGCSSTSPSAPCPTPVPGPDDRGAGHRPPARLPAAAGQLPVPRRRPSRRRTERCGWSCRAWTGTPTSARVRRDPPGRAGSPQVSRRLAAALDDLLELAPPERVACSTRSGNPWRVRPPVRTPSTPTSSYESSPTGKASAKHSA